jgi:WD40 repeat protein
MYSINGKKLRSRTDKHTLNAFAWSSDGSVLLAGGNLKLLLFFDARTLTLLEKIPHVVEFRSGGGEVGGRGAFLDGYCKETNAKPFDSPISSIRLCSAEDNLLVGLESGNMYCMNHEKGYLRKRLEKQLQSLGFF